MKPSEVKKEMTALQDSIIKAKDKYLEKVFTFGKKNIEHYNLKNNEEKRNQCFKIFLDALEESFSLTSKAVKKIYNRTQSFSVEDITSLAYKEDGKTLYERILRWWDDAYTRLQKKEMTLESACEYLLSRYDAIFDNEMKRISTAVKANKKPIVEGNQYLIISIYGCTCGECPNGDFPEDYAELPPYHSYCHCDWCYEITDDEDDVEDLDLEEEDIE